MLNYNQLGAQKIIDMKKTLSSAGASDTVIPVIIPQTINFLVDYKNPLIQNLTRKNQNGGKYYEVLRTAGKTLTMSDPESSSIADDTGAQPTEHTFNFKAKVGQVSITKWRRAISSGDRGIDLFAMLLKNYVLDVRNLLDSQYHTGDGTGYNIYGLKPLITQYVLAGSCDAGNTITTELLDEAIDTCKKIPPDMMITSLAVRRKIQALLQDQQRYVNTTTLRGGFNLLDYNGALCYPSSNMSITQNYTYSGGCEGAETGGTTGSIYFINSSDVFLCTLNNKYFTPTKAFMAETIYDGLDLATWITLVIENPQNLVKLVGIGPM